MIGALFSFIGSLIALVFAVVGTVLGLFFSLVGGLVALPVILVLVIVGLFLWHPVLWVGLALGAYLLYRFARRRGYVEIRRTGNRVNPKEVNSGAERRPRYDDGQGRRFI